MPLLAKAPNPTLARMTPSTPPAPWTDLQCGYASRQRSREWHPRTLTDILGPLSDATETLTSEIRNAVAAGAPKSEVDALKLRRPAFTASGNYDGPRGKGDGGRLNHTGLVSFDIDRAGKPDGTPGLTLDTAPAVRDALALYPFVAYVAVSSSGGVWGLVRVDMPADDWSLHARYMDYLTRRWEPTGIRLDTQNMQPNATRSLGYDAGARTNPSPEILTVAPEPPCKPRPRLSFAASTGESLNEREQLYRLAAHLEANGIDITGGARQWAGIGYAIAHELGDGGRDAYHRISGAGYAKYTERETDTQYSYALRSANGSVTLGTVYELAKRAGVAPSVWTGRDATWPPPAPLRAKCPPPAPNTVQATVAAAPSTVPTAVSLAPKPELADAGELECYESECAYGPELSRWHEYTAFGLALRAIAGRCTEAERTLWRDYPVHASEVIAAVRTGRVTVDDIQAAAPPEIRAAGTRAYPDWS